MIPISNKPASLDRWPLRVKLRPTLFQVVPAARSCRPLLCAMLAVCYGMAIFAQSPTSISTPTPISTNQSSFRDSVNPSPEQAPPEYCVGGGDVLSITVYNMPQLDRTTVVGSQGELVLSYLPNGINVSGQNSQQIATQIGMELKRLQILIDPQVSVSVTKVESKPVVVGGDVRTPQVLEEIRPFTLLEALMLAGGPQSEAGASVLVMRNTPSGMTTYDLSLAKVMAGTDANSNILVKPGDSIQVLPGQKVFVAGAVRSPGAFDLRGDQNLTISKLMALSGGWLPASSPSKAVIVRQDLNGQRQTIPVDLPKIMGRKQQDISLEANDLIFVPGSTSKKVGLAAVQGVGGAAMVGLGYMIFR